MPKTSRGTAVHPISLREGCVVRVTDLTPGMRRVTFGGPQLGAFTSDNGFDQPAFCSDGFDDEIRLVFAHPGQTHPILPVQIEGSLRPPQEGRTLSRGYTVRRWDPVSGELDVDFVKHDGIASTWAERAEPGDTLHFFGPLLSRSLPDEADWLLVAGDETALPAIGRLLDELPRTSRALVFIEVATDADRQPLRELPGVQVTWLVRERAEAGTATLLLDAVRSSPWPPGRPFAWIAGEQSAVRDLRRHLVDERALPKTEIEFTGYWKRRTAIAPVQDEATPDPEQQSAAEDEFHELTEIVPPIAIRVAAGLGLGELIARGVATPAALAAATNSDPRALGKLLRYLQAIGLLSVSASGGYALTDLGAQLADEHWIRALDPDGVHGRSAAGILGLAESVRTGAGAYASVTGKSHAALRAEQWYEDKYLDEAANTADLLAAAIAASPALQGVQHLVIHSPGAVSEAREIVAAQPDLRATICALPAQAAWVRRDLPDSIPDASRRDRVSVVEQSIFEPAPPCDAVLLVRALAGHPDADAVHALRRATANLTPGGRLLLLEDTFADEQLSEHDAEADLLALTRDGSGLRTEAELRTVIQSAGLEIVAVHRIGWGVPLYQLVHHDRRRQQPPSAHQERHHPMTNPTSPRRGAGLLAAALGAVMLFSACGSSPAPSVTAAPAPATEAAGFPVSVDSTHGEITLESKPQRIVVIGGDYVDLLASIGEQPVAFSGYGDPDEETLLTNFPWLKGLYTGTFDATLVTAEYKADAEAIGVHKPDLIIGSPYYIEKAQYDQLSAIAPTYVTPATEGHTWTDTLADLGALTGKSAEALKATTDVEKAFFDAREELASLEGKTVSLADDNAGTLRLMSSPSWIADLGLAPAANQPAVGTGFQELSAENLDELAGDLAFLVTYDAQSRAALEADPRLAELPSSKNESLFFVERQLIDAGLGAGPTSLDWLLGQLMPLLKQSSLYSGSE